MSIKIWIRKFTGDVWNKTSLVASRVPLRAGHQAMRAVFGPNWTWHGVAGAEFPRRVYVRDALTGRPLGVVSWQREEVGEL